MALRWTGWLGIAAVVASGCGQGFRPRGDLVARAGEYELSVDRLARLLATNKQASARPQVGRAVTELWVDYAIFAGQLLRGDSLTDSARLTAAMWPLMQQELADQYHAHLVAERVRLDSAQVDSAYAAGDLRLIQHVLFRVAPTAAQPVWDAACRRADQLAARLRGGQVTWEAAAQTSDDAASRSRGGSLGVIARGEQVVPFERAAFALAPGGLTDAVVTSFGCHVLRRPDLAEVREEFVEGVEERLEEAFDEVFLDALAERWEIRVRENIGPAVREMGADLLRAKDSREVVGTFRGGRLLMGELARWLQAAPIELRQGLERASDSQITELVTIAIRDRVLVREALDAGMQVASASRRAMGDELRRNVSALAALLELSEDSLAALRRLPRPDRVERVTTKIVDYLVAVAARQKPMQTVPPFLADALRDDARWMISQPAVERAFREAQQLRRGVGASGS